MRSDYSPVCAIKTNGNLFIHILEKLKLLN
jgi:hypothetical protein